MNQRLILITAGFPYGNSETFLESEIDYLAKAFKEVVILCPKPKNNQLRNIPKNCSASFYTKELSTLDKLKALKGLFNQSTINELKIIRKSYQLTYSKKVVSTLLISLYQAKRIAKVCQKKYLKDSELNSQTVFYSYWCDDTALALALLKENTPNIKCVSRTHGWDVYFGVHGLNYLPFRHLIADNINAIYPISNKGKQEIKEVWKVNDFSKVRVYRLGVRRQEQSRLNKSEVFTLLSCSNVIPLKRVQFISEAVLNYPETIKWVHFGDGPELNVIQKFSEDKKESHHDISFKGRVSNDEIMEFYRNNWVDAFINVSSSEGVPVSIMEAMSFGIPCIATDVGGNSEIVNNKNGVLLSANPSLNDIQNAFKEILNSDEKRKMAYQTWEERYNAEKNYTEFVGMLVKI